MPTRNEDDSETTAYSLLFQGMHPRVRDCDPCAYFRAKLAGLRQARESLLTDDEYAAERQGVFDTIVSPARYPPLMFPLLMAAIIGGVAATSYGLAAGQWGWVGDALPATVYALWSLQGFRKHHAWLNAIPHAHRTDIINCLRDAELIDDDEASGLLSRLDAALTKAE